MSTLAASSGVQRGIFTEEGRGAARLLSGNQCKHVRGWLAAGHTAVGLLWTGEHGEPEEKTLRYNAVRSDACVCSLCVCLCICGWVHLSSSFCMWVTVCLCVCEILHMCLCISTMLPCACEHHCCMCIHVFSHCWCIMHDKKTICKAALALIWPDCCFRLGHPD